MSNLGPTFGDELIAAGLGGLPITWRPDDGIVEGRERLTPVQNTALDTVLAAHDPNKKAPATFLSRDLLALLTDDDQAAIDAALAANVTWRRIWNALLAQGDAPISVASPRFTAGWSGLVQALGQARADEIATALGIAAN